MEGIDLLREFFRGGLNDDSLRLDASASPVEDVLVNGKSVVDNHIAKINNGSSAMDLYKRGEYLYEIRYDDLDYPFADNFYRSTKPSEYGTSVMKPFACSSIRSGNFYGRNFDFYYNFDCDFIVRTSKKKGRNATIGVGHYFGKLTKDFVESGEYDDAYKILPFMLVDGINEYGLFVNINVVTLEKTPTIGTIPTCKQKGEVCMMMLPRFILDNYKTALEAILDIQAHYSVYFYNTEEIKGSELHLMIGDENETYIVEFDNNALIYEKLGDNHPAIMTNFYVIGTNLYNGKIDEEPENRSGVALLGCGIERYNKLIDSMDSADSKDGMLEAMKNIWYTNSYNPLKEMYTEMVGMPDVFEEGKVLTVESPREHYLPVMKKGEEIFNNRKREQGISSTWHTKHTSVYDIKERKLYMLYQENSFGEKEYEFNFNKKIVF